MTVADLISVRDAESAYLFPAIAEIAKLDEEAKNEEHVTEIVWPNVFIQLGLHIGGLVGLYMSIFEAKWQTNVFMFLMVYYAGTAITGGAHRMWTHRAFKANFWVRVFFMIGTTIAVQNDVIEWARDHRCHHKWSDSDADPHNIRRGFFFAHIGWLMCRKHPKVSEMGKKIDISDLEADPVLQFQREYYVILVPLLAFVLFTAVPMFFWNETLYCAFYVSAVLRLVIHLNGTWLINSASHMFGYQPFDTKITAVDNAKLSCITMGEAFHNYHHTFPQDYRASEYPWYINTTGFLIDVFAYFGWVWERKMMSSEAIERQKLQGDGSRSLLKTA